ncbi:unnamed protein product [Penicillium egyptiacum]|uniref:Uncharacterized protein n=2 Tax=Penicillium TaxID=5073 RepID=A0A9W4KE60_9EURO|nr:unnamed protein product [Penicillium egyptiacum]CDM37271.1 unnamed protein product [Penicillium roqueforti FM164]
MRHRQAHSVREWIDYISKLDYARAVSLLKKENAFLAGQEILKRYHDTAIWTIISKGAELLDPTTLPTASPFCHPLVSTRNRFWTAHAPSRR